MKEKCHKKHIGLLIKCLDKKIVQLLNKELEEYDLTLVQHQVLAYLSLNQDKHDVYQKEIEEYLESSNPTVTGIVKRLEMKELIQREAGQYDARCKRLSLTEKGMQLLDKARVAPQKMELYLTQYLGEKEVEKLIELLEKLLKGMDEV